MKRLAILLLMLPLTSCFDDQQRILAHCDLMVERMLHKRHHALDLGEAGSIIRICMKANGYSFDESQPRCPVNPNRVSNPYCYAPTGFFARLIYKLEMRFENV